MQPLAMHLRLYPVAHTSVRLPATTSPLHCLGCYISAKKINGASRIIHETEQIDVDVDGVRLVDKHVDRPDRKDLG